jgi:hypothetical protein
VVGALVRGGTDHRIDLLLDDGTIVHWFKDGTMEAGTMRWNVGKQEVG